MATSRSAGEVYKLVHDGIGDDLAKVKENLENRHEWIWTENLPREVDLASPSISRMIANANLARYRQWCSCNSTGRRMDLTTITCKDLTLGLYERSLHLQYHQPPRAVYLTALFESRRSSVEKSNRKEDADIDLKRRQERKEQDGAHSFQGRRCASRDTSSSK